MNVDWDAERSSEGVPALVPRSWYPTLETCRYLNQAALGLIPGQTMEAMVGFLTDVGHHGNLRLSDEDESQILDDLRLAASSLLDVPVSSVAITGGASEALSQLALVLSPLDGAVVLVSSDFPSVTYPWLAERERNGTEIRWVNDRPETDLTGELIQAIDDSTKVVSVSAVQYATGTRVDVPALTAKAEEVGCRVIVDVSQLAGAAPVSMREWSVDALVCSGYKWLSSHGGVAILALAPDLAVRTPGLVGWKGTNEPFSFDAQRMTLASDARRFELSTISYASCIGLLSSIELLTECGLARIDDHADRLASRLVDEAEPLGWAPFRPLSDPAASNHIVALGHQTIDARHAQRHLWVDHRVICSSRGGSLRVSMHLYNEAADIAALIEGLTAFPQPTS